MKPSRKILYAVTSLLLCTAAAFARPHETKKKLIQFGAGEPDTEFMRKHVAEMEKSPFQGCVFHAMYTNPDGSKGNFVWECWGSRAFTEQELKPALDDLKATEFKTFTDNYLRFNAVPGDVDWFDDFSPVLNNMRVAARFARDGRCKGIVLDVQDYNKELFNYRKQKYTATKSWTEYAGQARKRGRECMQALQDGFPKLTVFLTNGFELPFDNTKGQPANLPDAGYGLLAPFLNGMVDAADGGTRLFDACQSAYWTHDPASFITTYRKMKRDSLPFVEDPVRFRKRFSFGFGLWMDATREGINWFPDDVEKNFFTPAAFEASVREALKVSDEYVWIFTGQAKWWSDEGKPVDLPPAYDAALRNALKE